MTDGIAAETAFYGVAATGPKPLSPKPLSAPALGGRVLSQAQQGTDQVMRTDRSARRVLAFTMGVASIFDLTGAVTYRLLHPLLPEPPKRDKDPFQSAMCTIVSAHRDAVTRTRDKSGMA